MALFKLIKIMKYSHSHIPPRKTRSLPNKRKNKTSNNSIKDSEAQIKTESIFNFYNNSNINSDNELDESTLGEIEYAKTLQIALKDAINQNEKLSEELNKCIQENKELKEEIEEKDNVIYELSQFYQFCQNNHINNNNLNNSVALTDKDSEYAFSPIKKINLKTGKAKNKKKYASNTMKDN